MLEHDLTSKVEGYYGIVGNGETAALISHCGAIEWFCPGQFDTSPVFAKMLDPNKGGYLSLGIYNEKDGDITYTKDFNDAQQEYVKDTNVLDGTYSHGATMIGTRDYMPWGQHHLVRKVNYQLDENESLVLDVASTTALDKVGNVNYEKNRLVINSDDSYIIIGFSENVETELKNNKLIIKPGSNTGSFDIIVSYDNDERDAFDEFAYACSQKHSDRECIDFWHDWLSQGDHQDLPGELSQYNDFYNRSLLAMKVMTHKDGGIIAAPTASIPAVPNGTDNWDYRFVWLRDGSLNAESYIKAGYTEEAKKFLEFAFNTQEANGHWHHPLYTIKGETPFDEFVAEKLSGPNGETPIRFGNAASNQLQLDSEGSVIMVAKMLLEKGGDKYRSFIEEHWDQIRNAAKWIVNNYDRKENGIWEVRSPDEDYTQDDRNSNEWWAQPRENWVYGKVMCYTGLESALYLAKELGKENELKTEMSKWLEVKNIIKEDVKTKGWSEKDNAFVCTYEKADSNSGSTNPIKYDASVLAIRLRKMDKDDPEFIEKMNTTIDTLYEELQFRGGILRHDQGLYAFYLPQVWQADALLSTARQLEQDGKVEDANLYREKAQDLFEKCYAGSTSDLNLMAEHVEYENSNDIISLTSNPARDIKSKQYGNFPQSFSHMAIVGSLSDMASKETDDTTE